MDEILYTWEKKVHIKKEQILLKLMYMGTYSYFENSPQVHFTSKMQM